MYPWQVRNDFNKDIYIYIYVYIVQVCSWIFCNLLFPDLSCCFLTFQGENVNRRTSDIRTMGSPGGHDLCLCGNKPVHILGKIYVIYTHTKLFDKHLHGMYNVTYTYLQIDVLPQDLVKPLDSNLDFSNRSGIRQTSRKERCRDTGQSAKRYDHYNIQSLRPRDYTRFGTSCRLGRTAQVLRIWNIAQTDISEICSCFTLCCSLMCVGSGWSYTYPPWLRH